MCRIAVAVLFSSMALAQSSVILAAKSPVSLARYLESAHTVDWKGLRRALKLKELQWWVPPCGSNAATAGEACSVETISVRNPDQAIVVIRRSGATDTVAYLRYILDPHGTWKFSGEQYAVERNGPSSHELTHSRGKPILKITRDYSQHGVSITQEREDWFDLTQPDFDPVFSVTLEGSESLFAFRVWRDIHALSRVSQARGVEKIDVILIVTFSGIGFELPARYGQSARRISPSSPILSTDRPMRQC